MRVLQELELLAQTLQTRPRRSTENPVMRRLTRAEWKQFKETGIIPYENAVAVLVVPPLNKNPETKRRPTPSDSLQPIKEEPHPVSDKPMPPVSTLHPTTLSINARIGTHQYLPPAKIPLYNGIAAFPSRAQRAALYKALSRILAIERRARWREHGRLTDKRNIATQAAPVDKSVKEKTHARGDQKASHAFVLVSDSKTVLRADTVPLATALWRIRLWEGMGWDKTSKRTAAGGWITIKPYKLPE